MIVDRLEEAKQYCRLHPGFDAAFDLLASTPFDELAPGRHEVMGDSLVLIFEHVEPNRPDAGRLEAHRKYIDVQCIIPGKGAVAQEFAWHRPNQLRIGCGVRSAFPALHDASRPDGAEIPVNPPERESLVRDTVRRFHGARARRRLRCISCL